MIKAIAFIDVQQWSNDWVLVSAVTATIDHERVIVKKKKTFWLVIAALKGDTLSWALIV